MDPEADVVAQAQVVTHTFTGTSIPDGIPVGVVAPRSGPATRFLSVQPYVDFTRLTTVQVVLDFPKQPVDLPEEERVPAPKLPRPKPSPGTGKNGDR